MHNHHVVQWLTVRAAEANSRLEREQRRALGLSPWKSFGAAKAFVAEMLQR